MSHTCGNILLHLIFSTRERRPLIKPEFRSDLFAYLGGIVREMHGSALIINGGTDHVHMLVRIRPIHARAEIARVVKANSSRWVRGKWSRDVCEEWGQVSITIETQLPRNANELYFRLLRLGCELAPDARLAPWAAFLRRSAAWLQAVMT